MLLRGLRFFSQSHESWFLAWCEIVVEMRGRAIKRCGLRKHTTDPHNPIQVLHKEILNPSETGSFLYIYPDLRQYPPSSQALAPH